MFCLDKLNCLPDKWGTVFCPLRGQPLAVGARMRIGDVWISPSMLIKCANDVEIEETSLCNC